MTVPILHAHRPAKPAKRPLPQVHVLSRGRGLCGKPGVELDGATGHVWVSGGDAVGLRIASCPRCREAAGLEPR